MKRKKERKKEEKRKKDPPKKNNKVGIPNLFIPYSSSTTKKGKKRMLVQNSPIVNLS